MAKASVPDLTTIADLDQLMTYVRNADPAVRRQAVAQIGTLQDVPQQIVTTLSHIGARDSVDWVQKQYVNTIVAIGGPAASDGLKHIARVSQFETIRRDATYGVATVAAHATRLATQTEADVIKRQLGTLRLGALPDRRDAITYFKEREKLDAPTLKQMMMIGAGETVQSIRTQILDLIEQHGGKDVVEMLRQPRGNSPWAVEVKARLNVIQKRLKTATSELKGVTKKTKAAPKMTLAA
jgi:hypothetical protein